MRPRSRPSSLMPTDCKNCGTAFEGRFCNQCGQSAATHALNGHYLWHDVQHSLLHVDKGLLHTIKELFTRPGHMVREFIAGKRVQHFKPISLVLLLAGAYGFLYHTFHIDLVTDIAPSRSSKVLSDAALNEWMAAHYSLIILALLPVASLASFLAFHKVGYNGVEHFVINAFITAQHVTVRLVFFPLLLLIPTHRFLGSTIPDLIGVILTFWTLNQLFDGLSGAQRFWRSVLYYLLSGVVVMLLAIGIGVVYAAWSIAHHH
mgnify:CR=1 FL=1